MCVHSKSKLPLWPTIAVFRISLKNAVASSTGIPLAPFDSAEYDLAVRPCSWAGQSRLSTASLMAGIEGLVMSTSAKADSFFVYIVRCADDSLYVGHTSHIAQRVKAHNEGRGALWTACRRPIHLVYQESYLSEAGAIVRERQLKRWTHAKKLALIHGDLAKLKSLAKRPIYRRHIFTG